MTAEDDEDDPSPDADAGSDTDSGGDPGADAGSDASPDRDQDRDRDQNQDRDQDQGRDRDRDQETLAVLPESLRAAFKEPLGPVHTEVQALLDGADGPVVAVGDVVTYHLLEAGVEPAVTVLDGRTERSAVDRRLREALPLDAGEAVPNEAGTLSAELVGALVEAVEAGESRVVVVDGEEDLAVLPALVAAPDGAVVVYGQPGEGMVRVDVDGETRDRARDLLERMDPEDRLWALLV